MQHSQMLEGNGAAIFARCSMMFPVSTFVLLMPVAEDMIQIKDQSFLKEQWSLLLLLNIWFGHQCRLPISFLLMSRYLQFEVGCLR